MAIPTGPVAIPINVEPKPLTAPVPADNIPPKPPNFSLNCITPGTALNIPCPTDTKPGANSVVAT